MWQHGSCSILADHFPIARHRFKRTILWRLRSSTRKSQHIFWLIRKGRVCSESRPRRHCPQHSQKHQNRSPWKVLHGRQLCAQRDSINEQLGKRLLHKRRRAHGAYLGHYSKRNIKMRLSTRFPDDSRDRGRRRCRHGFFASFQIEGIVSQQARGNFLNLAI